jgi:hypothetical protein
MATTTNSPAAPRSRHAHQKKLRLFRSPLQVVVIILLAIAMLAGGVFLGFHWPWGSQSTAQSSTMPPQPTAMPAPPAPATPTAGAPAPTVTGQFATEFASLAADLNAQAGIVVRAVGTGPEPVSGGDWSTGTAWSTIKVPLAIAALRETDPPQATDAMRAAITQSDNDAAESIWQSLGDPPAAAKKVEAVLAEAGAPTTVESRKVRPEFTAFGQTTWSLNDQATFLSSAACDQKNQPIMDLMGQISPDQSWGLGEIAGTKFKGGWGPSLEGSYLVRQLGVIPVRDGFAVVAVAVEPNSGSFDDGTLDLTQIATWLQQHTDLLPSGNCA